MLYCMVGRAVAEVPSGYLNLEKASTLPSFPSPVPVDFAGAKSRIVREREGGQDTAAYKCHQSHPVRPPSLTTSLPRNIPSFVPPTTCSHH